MKYKVGDRIKVREDLIVGKEYGNNDFAKEMVPWRGQIATIAHCTEDGYMLEGDDWYWTDEMIEGLVSEASNDTVNHPAHYTQGKIECIDYIIDKKLSYCLGNAIKYITRCELKNGGKNRIEDLQKAVFYINKQIAIWEAKHE
jgi:dipeptidase